MEKMDAALRARLAASPDETVHLIVRTDGDPTPHLARLGGLGLRVDRRFRVLPGVAVSGRASGALLLTREPWVLTIEEDRPVSAA